ncbi:MAG: single-stranded-DNA-specific exonuclease RecJ [Planctomycetota bacterium]
MLLNREIDGAAAARRYLSPSFKELDHPSTLAGAAAAAERLISAARAGRRIVIYGDYDVDGITASAILWHMLKSAGTEARCYVPSRFEEGYGISAPALERLATEGAQLVISVDCGITAVAEAEHARRLGLELIISDHHAPREKLPDALLVHPTAAEPACPNPNLSGAGVALKIAWAMALTLSGGDRVAERFVAPLVEATGLAALGLIADVVPLVGENRIIAAHGLRHLGSTRNPGLQALISVAGLASKKKYDDYDVGFVLAPRLNAIGRMGHAIEAVELLTTADHARALAIAEQLDTLNRERQQVEKSIVAQAEAMVVERGYDRDGCRGIVLASEAWHVGVVGIVASRIVERFHRPTVLIALDSGLGQGSARSIRHFPLHEALAACSVHLESHGGHAMAAGVRVRADRVPAFTEAFQQQAANRLTAADMQPVLHLDDEVPLDAFTPEIVSQLERMAPFGMGNRRPRFSSLDVELAEEPELVGAGGAHLRFAIRESRGAGQRPIVRRAIAFRMGDRCQELAARRRVRIAFEPKLNHWNGQTRVELNVLDWRYLA